MTKAQDDLDYAQHVKEDTQQWEGTVTAAAQFMGRLQTAGPALLRDEFSNSVVRSALEVFEQAAEQYMEYKLPREMDHAANMAVRLALLVLKGAPPVVIDHHYANLKRALDRARDASPA
jgi:hypothetical protein